MQFREDVSIDIDSASGRTNASLEIKYFGFWSGLFGGAPFKTDRWTFMEDELVPVDALNLVCARLMRAGVRETTIEELRKNTNTTSAYNEHKGLRKCELIPYSISCFSSCHCALKTLITF